MAGSSSRQTWVYAAMSFVAASALYLTYELGRYQAGYSLLDHRRERAGFAASLAEEKEAGDELRRQLAISETAAEIDRASRWTVFRRITLPMCAPLLFLAALLRTTDALKQFDFVMPVTGPNDASTQTISALLFQLVLKEGKVGLGSAYGFVVLIAVIALATVFTRYIGAIQKSQGKEAA